MPFPADQELYDAVKKYAGTIYDKPSAYKSGYIVKKYKELGGRYVDDKNPKDLKRWFAEKWVDINPLLGKTGYPTYRPTKVINNKTPLSVQEIPVERLNEQYKLKQKIKGKKNLPEF
jgi:hypothetical protein